MFNENQVSLIGVNQMNPVILTLKFDWISRIPKDDKKGQDFQSYQKLLWLTTFQYSSMALGKFDANFRKFAFGIES
jgi:hypothetical protein